jgi:hypothetical protein
LGNITIEALETEKAATDYTDQSMGVPPATIDDLCNPWRLFFSDLCRTTMALMINLDK